MSDLNSKNKAFISRLATFSYQMDDLESYSMDEINESARRLAIYVEAAFDDREALKAAKAEIAKEKQR